MLTCPHPTHFELRSSRDFAINGRAVKLLTVNRFSLSSSSISLCWCWNTAIVFVEWHCNWLSMASDAGRLGESVPLTSNSTNELVICKFARSANGTGGAEWMENIDPAELQSTNAVLTVSASSNWMGQSDWCRLGVSSSEVAVVPYGRNNDPRES